MRKQVKLLKNKAVESLILSIEIFNRPAESGRKHGVLILLDHAFEMLLKAVILHRGGKIRDPQEPHNFGFEACVNHGLSTKKVKFLNESQAVVLRAINGLRDAAQHDHLEISEQLLYMQCQAGTSLFRTIFESVFKEHLWHYLPERVLPISTTPPVEIAALFEQESEEIKKLLSPQSRRMLEGNARLRTLAILEKSAQGGSEQPTHQELKELGSDLRSGKKSWADAFPAVATLRLTTNGYGPSLDLKITKTEGIPIQLRREGDPTATIVAVKRVNELGFYTLGRDDLAKKVGLTSSKTTAMIRFLKLQENPDAHSKITIGKMSVDRYSPKAIQMIKESLKTVNINDVWAIHGFSRTKR